MKRSSLSTWIKKYFIKKRMDRVFVIIISFIIFLVIFWLYNYFFRKKYYDSLFPNFSDFRLYNKEKKKKYYKTEEKCRNIFRDLTGLEFKKVRPAFLKYKTNRCLELDGYNPMLNIAFEYNGEQHYKFTPFFHKSLDDFHEQLRHDQFKRDKCRSIGIRLIEIPYTVKEDDLKSFIKMELSR